MKIIPLAQNISFMYANIFNPPFGTYNNMKRQNGFCKMTGFNTVSRSTSDGPCLFTSGRVKFGVGLSQFEFGSQFVQSINNVVEGSIVCGMCINITKISNFPLFNFELNSYENINTTESHVAMIFDQCTDPICTSGFLDIDVYDDNIFTKSNTYNISWNAIDCPTYDNEKIEFLICSTNTCNMQDSKYKNVSLFENLFNKNYFSIVPRNFKSPIKQLCICVDNNYIELPYVSGNGFTFNGDFNENSLSIRLETIFNETYYENFTMDTIFQMKPLESYRGGVILNKNMESLN